MKGQEKMLTDEEIDVKLAACGRQSTKLTTEGNVMNHMVAVGVHQLLSTRKPFRKTIVLFPDHDGGANIEDCRAVAKSWDNACAMLRADGKIIALQFESHEVDGNVELTFSLIK